MVNRTSTDHQSTRQPQRAQRDASYEQQQEPLAGDSVETTGNLQVLFLWRFFRFGARSPAAVPCSKCGRKCRTRRSGDGPRRDDRHILRTPYIRDIAILFAK
jgi:hypothetical protein